MNNRLRYLMLCLTAVVAGIFVPAAIATGTAMAEPVCSNSTNWDNFLHTCR